MQISYYRGSTISGFSLFNRWTSSPLSMQSPINREICRSCIMEIVPFLGFQHLMDVHSLSLSGGQEWQFHIATDIYWSRMAISHCY